MGDLVRCEFTRNSSESRVLMFFDRKIRQNACEKISLQFSLNIAKKTSDGSTVYNFDTMNVDGKPEVQFKCLKRLVGERGFEPPTPWSRTRFSRLWSSIELRRSQEVVIEGVGAEALSIADVC